MSDDKLEEVRARLLRVIGEANGAVTRRDDRWLVLGEQHVAFAAADDAEWARLRTEAALLVRWREAGVCVPRVLVDDAAERVQVRERLDGIMGEIVEPLLFGTATLADIARISSRAPAGSPLPGGPLPDGYARLDAACPLTPFGERLAQSYGALAARMHSAISLDDAAAIGITTRRPFDLDAALVRLRATPIARRLVERAEADRAWIAEPPPNTSVVHGDLHFHNMCLADDGSIIGVFDVGDAHVDAAPSEFHYVHSLGPRFVETALDAYGAPLDIVAIRRAHVRTALGHLEWVAPEAPRYPSILSWVMAVLDRLLP